MNNKEKKGFTLIELLAVIVILAVIALIIIPVINGIIKTARDAADLRSAEGYVKAGENYYARSINDNNIQSTLNTNVIDKLDLSGNKGTGSVVVRRNGDIAMAIIINDKCYIKEITDTIGDITVNNDINNCKVNIPPYQEQILNGASPIIGEGMIPVILSNNGVVTKADVTENWYSYEEKKWANAVLVTANSRQKYIDAYPYSLIDEKDILAYYVWIPRFKYKLFTGGVQEIKIDFESIDVPKSNSTLVGEWLTHPAFTFGNEELNGIWIGKFETTGTVSTPSILPNKQSIRESDVSYLYNSSKLFNDVIKYGINSDAHMTKNSEWGAVAYLSNSKYGRCNNNKCEEISINNSQNGITGISAGKPGDNTTYSYSAPTYTYNTIQGGLASTTGNITGIYDMSGGTFEFVMANVISDSSISTLDPTSGINTSIDSKYYQLYKGDTIETACDGNICYGDAMSETKGWYTDYYYYKKGVSNLAVWMYRGGNATNNSSAGIWFFRNGMNSVGAFRMTLAGK